jgi:hypothetical protein
VTAHTCHAEGCDVRVPPRMLMCRAHWFMVPKTLRGRVWATYVHGQERRKDPTPEYLEAAQAAIDAVAAAEGRR